MIVTVTIPVDISQNANGVIVNTYGAEANFDASTTNPIPNEVLQEILHDANIERAMTKAFLKHNKEAAEYAE